MKKIFKNPLFYTNVLLVILIILLATNTNKTYANGLDFVKTFVNKVIAASSQITSPAGGTLNYLANFVGAASPSYSIGDSIVYDDGAGHVGVGTITPNNNKLAVNGTLSVYGVNRGNADSDWGSMAGKGVYPILNTRSDTDFEYVLGGVGIVKAEGYESPFIYGYSAVGNKIVFGSITTGDRNPATGLTPRMVINTDNGNVGIGTVVTGGGGGNVEIKFPDSTINRGLGTPAQLFISDTTITQTANSGGRIDLGGYNNGLSTRYTWGGIKGSAQAASGNRGYLSLFTQDTNTTLVERMRIDGDGNVGIGTTNPQAKLEINGGLRLVPGASHGTQIGEIWLEP